MNGAKHSPTSNSVEGFTSPPAVSGRVFSRTSGILDLTTVNLNGMPAGTLAEIHIYIEGPYSRFLGALRFLGRDHGSDGDRGDRRIRLIMQTGDRSL
jgi:hypothetical protein